jgi:superfamily II DNA or RNA helicase
MALTLRPRQLQALDDLRAAYGSGSRAPVLVAPTGFGKTAVSCEIIRSCVARGGRVWFLAHLREILDDTAGRLRVAGILFGQIRAGIPPDPDAAVQLVGVQTAARREIGHPPSLIIIDECHLAVAETYRRVISAADSPLLLGLTGTPERLDGRGLGELFDRLVPTCSTSELICEGLLASCRVFAPPGADLSQLRTRAGEFDQGQAGEILSRPTVVGDALEHWQRLCQGRRGVAFCSTVRHAETVAEQWRSAGLRAVAVSGGSDDEERRGAVQLLRSGELDLVACAQLWVAGVDVPALDAVVWLRPTQSLTVWLQGCGRGLRMADGKIDCLILDHVGNALRHGLPQDPREWSLNGRRKRRRQGEAALGVRQCEACFCCYPPQLLACPECGMIPVVKARRLVQTAGELREIKEGAMRARRREQGQARTLAELVALGKARGMSNPWGWAYRVIAGRKGRDIGNEKPPGETRRV